MQENCQVNDPAGGNLSTPQTP